jgi:hypothetical protein
MVYSGSTRLSASERALAHQTAVFIAVLSRTQNRFKHGQEAVNYDRIAGLAIRFG